MAIDIKELDGKPLKDVVEMANQKFQQAQHLLLDAERIYEECASQRLELYKLARIKGELWKLRRMGGRVDALYFSQSGQDEYIHDTFFKDKEDGFYLEIGGYNGWLGSNCLFFELRGWQGIVVEASPTQFRELSKFRRGTLVNAAISDSNGTAEFVDVVKGYTQMSGLADTCQRLEGVRLNPVHEECIVQVPTLTMAELCSSHGIDHVDYCSIDIEDGEFAALDGIDFDRINIDVISTENAQLTADTAPRKLLESNGYELVEVLGFDEIFKRR